MAERTRGEASGKQPRGSAGMKDAGGAGWLDREVDTLNVGRRFEQFCSLCFRKGCAGASLVAQR